MLGSCEHGKELVHSIKVKVSVFQERLCPLEGGGREALHLMMLSITEILSIDLSLHWQSLSWKTAKLSLSCHVWTPKFNCHIHKYPSFDPILSQLRSVLILSFSLYVELPSGHSQSGCPTKTVCVFLPYMSHAPSFMSLI
jgi:hypothetical protein